MGKGKSKDPRRVIGMNFFHRFFYLFPLFIKRFSKKYNFLSLFDILTFWRPEIQRMNWVCDDIDAGD